MENWVLTTYDDFGLSISRIQGIDNDLIRQQLFFSGLVSLERTNLSCQNEKTNTLAIPQDLYTLGYRHMGSIGVREDAIYVPLENRSTGYQDSKILQYDKNSLSEIDENQRSTLPNHLLPDGCPWIAIDEFNKRLYTSQFAYVETVYVFDLETLTHQPKEDISLGKILYNVQGSRMYEGNLYMVEEEGPISKVNIATGQVTEVFNLRDHITDSASMCKIEAESLTFYEQAQDGSTLHILVLVYLHTSWGCKFPQSRLYHFKRL